ncbi:hypothetical protein BV22DRAFT_1006914 [Leucogyrophana mollusca]|uniref:Uncharacterized protein n=1 Tax=Leucogyrophana mollusca TaxID=85980 RepID=A0ACB8BNK1_9AGAM|nr:hypothetical protein BV22DRAFT_1006914 [Leucogyrophana mollusca]
MDSPKLRKLTRAQIQAIAKAKLVRAVGKTEEIIRRLIKKHPGGIPEDLNGTRDPSGPARGPRPTHASPGGRGGSVAPVTEEPEDDTLPEEGEQSSDAPLNDALAVKQDGGPADADSYVPVPIHGLPEPDLVDDDDDATSYISYPRVEAGPDERDVRLVLRQFTTLVNDMPEIEKLMREAQALTDKASAIINVVEPKLREACTTRQFLEDNYLAQLKAKRERWDGTAFMERTHRRRWITHLKRQRKNERVKKWQEQALYDITLGIEPLEYEFYQ